MAYVEIVSDSLLEEAREGDAPKIEIVLQSVGSAPILKKKRFVTDPTKDVAFLSALVKRMIKLGPNESVFLYVNQAFAPALNTVLQDLYDCYNIDGKLVIHYCTTQAWG